MLSFNNTKCAQSNSVHIEVFIYEIYIVQIKIVYKSSNRFGVCIYLFRVISK